MIIQRYHADSEVFYVTTNTYGHLPLFTRPSFILPLLDSLNYYRHKYIIYLLGYVIMPNHIHLLLWPEDPARLADMMRDFKKFTSVRIIRQAEVEGCRDWVDAFSIAGKKTGRSEHKVWQDSYWDKNIFSKHFLRQKLNYIHRNPVRAGLVGQPEDYPYSSYRNYTMEDQSLIEIDRDWIVDI